jgi:hypothetical protein
VIADLPQETDYRRKVASAETISTSAQSELDHASHTLAILEQADWTLQNCSMYAYRARDFCECGGANFGTIGALEDARAAGAQFGMHMARALQENDRLHEVPTPQIPENISTGITSVEHSQALVRVCGSPRL